MPDQPTPDQSFSIHLKSLLDFADEFKTQIDSIQAPMDHLATMSSTPPQYGAFAEAWSLGAGEQAAIEEMYSLLGQVKQAIAFAGNVTGTVADGYRKADENIASALGGPAPVGSRSHESGRPVSGNPWQFTQVTATQIQFPDPSSAVPAGPVDGSGPATGPTAPPMPGTPMTGPVTHGVTGAVAGSVTGVQPASGHLPAWTPPPAPAPAPPAPGPDPSWTDYFQGIPQGGA